MGFVLSYDVPLSLPGNLRHASNLSDIKNVTKELMVMKQGIKTRP